MSPVKVFISHGHNPLAALKITSFVRDRLHLEPVVLRELPDNGMTVVEKLEHYSKNCSFALVVLTADDTTREGGLRARQNVVHELGFFHGLLGRKKVLLLKQSNVEVFSNISGLIYKEFDGDDVERIYEDVRMAIESQDASQHAETVPNRSLLTKDFVDTYVEGTVRLDDVVKKRYWEKITAIGLGLDDRSRIGVIKAYIRSELNATRESLGKIERALEDRKGQELSEGEALSQISLAWLAGPTEKHVRLLQTALEAIDELQKTNKALDGKTVLGVLRTIILEG